MDGLNTYKTFYFVGDFVFLGGTRNIKCSICVHKVPSIHIWQEIYHWKLSQTTERDILEINFKYTIKNTKIFNDIRDELIRDVLLWTPTHGRAKAGRPARTYIQQLCKDRGCCPEDLPRAMNDRRSGERGSGISVLPARYDDDDDIPRNQS